jgi:subtilisin family serine protease
VTGVAGGLGNYGVQLMILNIGHTDVNQSVVDDAITYAAHNGADVIQMSFGISWSQAIEDAIEDAYENHGVVLVCSAGNYPPGNSNVRFPAYDTHVIAVGSTSSSDSKSSFSCYGPTLEISAPGESIYTTTLNNSYTNNDVTGTSFAAPQVSATAALLLSVSPTLTPDSIRAILRSSADKVGGYNYNSDQNNPGLSDELGYGRLDVEGAISSIYPTLSGPDIVCSSNSVFTINDLPSEATVTWHKSDNLEVVSSTSTTLTVTANGNGYGGVEARIYNDLYYDPIYLDTYYVWVGVPNTPTYMAAGDPLCRYSYVGFGIENPGNPYNTYYDWRIESEIRAGIYYGQGTTSASVYSYDIGYITLSVAGQNQCGTSDYFYADPYYIDDCYFKMVLSPNPATDHLKIELSEDPNGVAMVDVFNSQGIKVISTTINSKGKTIDVSKLPKGVYYVTVFSKGKINNSKFIKE